MTQPNIIGSGNRYFQFFTHKQLNEAINSVYSQMKEIVTSDETLEAFFDSDLIIEIQLQSIENNRKECLTAFMKKQSRM
ncbi:hypothetical protein KHA80_17305 [Anaerobacillus sp. HL2]|nr:hypothetical protein KHA80_17305 [Anaerobacillus sp. HL2]